MNAFAKAVLKISNKPNEFMGNCHPINIFLLSQNFKMLNRLLLLGHEFSVFGSFEAEEFQPADRLFQHWYCTVFLNSNL